MPRNDRRNKLIANCLAWCLAWPLFILWRLHERSIRRKIVRSDGGEGQTK